MKTSRPFPSLLAAAALAFVSAICTRADEPTTVKFSDPSKPGTVKINLGRGELVIQGADTPEVTVKSDAKPVTSKPRKDGMRVLSAASSYSLQEKDNVVTLDSSADFGRGGNGDYKLTVPRNTTVVVQNAWGGDIKCAGISGDLEITCMHGQIQLEDISGGAVVSTMNGEIRASIRELRDGKPLSFTSMNGEVVLRVAADAKANVRLRTQNGSVLTDFEETALVTKTENSPGLPRTRVTTFKGKQVISSEVQDAIREATQLGASAVKEALEAVKEGLEAAKLDNDQARHDLDSAKRDLERAHREAARDQSRADRERSRATAPEAPTPPTPPTEATPATAPKAPRAPGPFKIAMPTMTGGKLVTGTLNGGGPEISVSTMNGDVVLRKLDKK